MDSWQELPTALPDLAQSGMPYPSEDWEEWLRWDPTTEPLSPEGSSKDSNGSPNQYAALQGEQFPVLGVDETLAPPLIVGDEASMLGIDGTLDKPSFNFTEAQDASPFVFGGEDTLQHDIDFTQLDVQLPNSTFWPPTTGHDQSLVGSLEPLLMDHFDGQFASAAHLPSPVSGPQTRNSVSSTSPEPPRKKGGRKRKASSGDESKSADSGSPVDGEPPVKKTSHNVIEKRYRNNLNDKIQELRDSVPSLRAMSRTDGGGDGSEDLEGLAPAHKQNKSTIMAKATEYIKHLEKRNKSMVDDMAALKARMESLEKAFARSSAVQSRQSAASARALSPVASGQQPIAQMSDPSRFHPAEQQQYMQQHVAPQYAAQPVGQAEAGQTPHVNGRGGTGMMSKLMVGSLAGLMVMEGFHEHEQSRQSPSGRGLFAVPTHLFRRGDVYAGDVSSSQAMLPLFKTALLIGALLYLVLPLLGRKPPPPPKAAHQVRLTAAPSLASPVEMRRKAWLTAVQSVWVPRHFLLEVVAVTQKIILLSLRRLIGSDRYSVISGISKDDEAARIKAWDIAIDAQLAGGDAEISYYRLLLTLMASGTLPDSPIRLMQKAVHFRIFFWEVANAGYGNMSVFKDFTAKVGKIYWDSARSQQNALLSGANNNGQDLLEDKVELLPDHLAHLIALDCDDVLTDEMIQRAYNLAWNRPSAEKTTANRNMDSVVEDHAIRSPLDAIAAWHTNTTIDDVLGRALDANKVAPSSISHLINLATETAPPASGTQTRAFVVRAVLLPTNREAHIATALATMPPMPITSPTALRARLTPATLPMNLANQTPVSHDVRTALTLAKLLSLASPSNPAHARAHAASALVSLHLPSFTLLTAVAAHKVLGTFAADALLFSAGKVGLEDLATGLRVWVGTREGRLAGLSRRRKSRIVETCVGVAKRVGGWKGEEERGGDSGYASARAAAEAATAVAAAAVDGVEVGVVNDA